MLTNAQSPVFRVFLNEKVLAITEKCHRDTGQRGDCIQKVNIVKHSATEGCPVRAEMAQAEPFEPDLGHASEGTGRQFCLHYRHCLFTPLHARISPEYLEVL